MVEGFGVSGIFHVTGELGRPRETGGPSLPLCRQP